MQYSILIPCYAFGIIVMAMQTAAEAEAVVLPLMADEMMPEKTKDHVIRRIANMSGVL